MKWNFFIMAVLISGAAEAGGKRGRMTIAPVYYVPQPYVILTSPPPRYYQPLPQMESSQKNWSGQSTDHYKDWSVDQRYAVQAGHQCEHGPGSSKCSSGFDSNRDYQMSEGGEAFAGGSLNDQAGGTRNYQHNGNPYSVQQMLQREREQAQVTPCLAEAAMQIAKVKVQLKVAREKLMRERTTENAEDIDRRLANLDEIERKLMALEDRSLSYRRELYGN